MIHAVEHIRPMRGGAQSHLIRADDNRYYVVKALNNPQHPLILANEWLASNIARAVGIPVPDFEVVDVPQELLDRSPGMVISCGGHVLPFAEGYAFGSRLPTPDPQTPVYDYLPQPAFELVENLGQFAGCLLIDKWLCNCDGRQAIFCRPKSRKPLQAFFIDWGFCFNAGDWTFPDSPLRGVFSRNFVYQRIIGWDSFEPWISRIEAFKEAKLLSFITSMPIEWTPDGKAQVRLNERLMERRTTVRSLIHAVRLSARAPFEHWTT